MKIGIFDSGLGGLFLMKPIVEALPQYDYLYLGDTANLPYGDKSPDEVYQFALAGVKYLFEQDCAIVLVMCNTISAEALRRLQGEGYRALGIIIPTVESVTGNRIGVLATQGTVNSETYIKEIHKLLPNAHVFQQAAPKLVPMIESGILNIPAYAKIVNNYLVPLLAHDIDTLILGCTHYVVLKDLVRKLVPENIGVISQDELIADKVRNYLSRHPEIESKLSRSGTQTFVVTKLTPEFQAQAEKWFEKSLKLEEVKY
ncbi:MAG: glutamate racemase [Patescibacteria group bacterium]